MIHDSTFSGFFSIFFRPHDADSPFQTLFFLAIDTIDTEK